MNGSLLLFATLALVTVATPGPTTLLALNHGARHGIGAALPGVAGAVLLAFAMAGRGTSAGSRHCAAWSAPAA